MKYRAKTDGFVDSHYVYEGEVFEYDGAAPSWATPLEEAKPTKLNTTGEAGSPPPAPKKKATKK